MLLPLGIVAIVVAATVFVILSGGDRPKDDPVVTPTRTALPQDVADGAFVAPVEGAATRLSPTAVRFTWKSGDPRQGDFFLVTRTDAGPGPSVKNQRQETTTYDLRGTDAAEPCIAVVLVRANGQFSEPSTICADT
jgi:hypothetical protein